MLAFLLILLPLLVLAWQAWQSLNALSDQAALVNRTTLIDARRSEAMTNAALEMERSYRQYCVLDDPTLAKVYQSQRKRYSEMLDAHAGVLPDDKLYQALRQDLNNLAQLQCNNSGPDAAAAARLEAFASANTEMVQATRTVVFSRGQQLQREIAERGQYFGWQSLVLFLVSLVNMRHIFQRLLPRRLWLAGLPCLALLGCVQSHNKPAIDTPAEEKIPVYQLADYLSTECSDIWALQGKSTETNPLYWLRAMDCADRLMPAQSRQQARQYDDGSWQNTFKQGILLADAKITPYERRQLVARIDALSTEIPAQVRPLYQLWRDGQALQLQLAEERQRYGKLQQASDSELDTLRQQHHVLQQQLELTTRKLENLTDIERQLSTRKPAGNFSPDTPHEGEKPAPSTHEVTPDEP